MPALRKGRRSVEEQVRTELQQIRTQVAGVRGSLVATSDGLVVAHDIPDLEPTQIAALAAATLAVARRATLATDIETALKEAMTIDGALGVWLVDWDSGMSLGALGGGKYLDLDVAAAGNTESSGPRCGRWNRCGSMTPSRTS